MQQIHDDEIDLLKSLETLWNDKWLIVAFTFIAILIGTGYIYYKKPLTNLLITILAGVGVLGCYYLDIFWWGFIPFILTVLTQAKAHLPHP